MTDALQGPRLKIKRANEQIDEIHRIERATFVDDVYALVEEVEPQSGDRLLKIKLSRPIPLDDLQIRIAETVYHLRSSLDQTVIALARKAGIDTDKCSFPFAGDAKEFVAKGPQGKIEGIDPRAVDVIRAIQPYKGGNDALWGLGRLANVDKHIELIAIGTIGNISVIQNLHIVGAKIGLILGGGNRLDEGILLSNLGRNGQITSMDQRQPNFQISGHIAFGDVDVFKNQPVVPTLLQLTQVVQGVVNMLAPFA